MSAPAAGDADVVLSYRHASDRDFAQQLYDRLCFSLTKTTIEITHTHISLHTEQAGDEAGTRDQRREDAHEGDAAAGGLAVAPITQDDDMRWNPIVRGAVLVRARACEPVSKRSL